MDNFFPSELISLLNSNTRGRIELGRIDLMKNFSFFEVEEKETQNVIKALNRANWNGRRVSVEIAGEEGGEGRRNSDRSNDKSGVKGRNGRSKDTQKDNSTSASAKPRKEKASKTPASTDSKKQKPSREERGYKNARGKKTIGSNSSKMKNRISVKRLGTQKTKEKIRISFSAKEVRLFPIRDSVSFFSEQHSI